MPKFTIPDEFAGLRVYAGGREYEFEGTELEVEQEADAKRVRTFAREQPQWQIAEDGDPVGPEPEPAPEGGEVTIADEATTDGEPTNDNPGDAGDEPAEPEPKPRRRRARDE